MIDHAERTKMLQYLNAQRVFTCADLVQRLTPLPPAPPGTPQHRVCKMCGVPVVRLNFDFCEFCDDIPF